MCTKSIRRCAQLVTHFFVHNLCLNSLDIEHISCIMIIRRAQKVHSLKGVYEIWVSIMKFVFIQRKAGNKVGSSMLKRKPPKKPKKLQFINGLAIGASAVCTNLGSRFAFLKLMKNFVGITSQWSEKDVSILKAETGLMARPPELPHRCWWWQGNSDNMSVPVYGFGYWVSIPM